MPKKPKLTLSNLTLEEMDSLIEECLCVCHFNEKYTVFKDASYLKQGKKRQTAKKKTERMLGEGFIELGVFSSHIAKDIDIDYYILFSDKIRLEGKIKTNSQ